MPVDQVRSRLWTPDGNVPLEKDVVLVQNARHRIALVNMHEFAVEHGLSLVCQRCDTAITGRNSGSEQFPSVSCQCREFRLVK